MLVPILLGVGAYLAYKHYVAPGAPAAPAPTPPLMATVNTHAMTKGASYYFVVASALSSEDVVAALVNVGATVQGPLHGVSASGTNTWGGSLTWNGLDGEPVTNLPGVQWVLLDPAATSPSATVSGSGFGYVTDKNAALRKALE